MTPAEFESLGAADRVADLMDQLGEALERRDFVLLDPDDPRKIRSRTDLEAIVERLPVDLDVARITILVAVGVNDDPRVHMTVAEAVADLPETARCHVTPDRDATTVSGATAIQLNVWLEELIPVGQLVDADQVVGQVVSRAERLARQIDDALDRPPRWLNSKNRFGVGSTYSERPGLDELLERLNTMVGLDQVNVQIQQLISSHRVSEQRQSLGLAIDKRSPHLVFTGNPGTGKTTVARMIGQIYAELGLLDEGHLVEADRPMLIGSWVGQTAPRTAAVIQRALGGVLFIDEAYALTPPNSQNDFGAEAVEVLLTEMENRRGEFAVIVAGYPEPMTRFLQSNPGLDSRFDNVVHFRDYTDEELLEIFRRRAGSRDYVLGPGFEDRLRAAISALERGADFANGRAVRKLFDRVRSNQERRLHLAGSYDVDDLRTLLAGDVGDAAIPRQRATHWAGYL